MPSARELAGSAFADGVLKLTESETQSMVDVPGVGPTPMSAPPTPAGDDALDGEGQPELSDQERYAQALHDRTAM